MNNKKASHRLHHQEDSHPFVGRFLGYSTHGMNNLAEAGIQYSLLYWYQISKYTCDRNNLLTVQDKQADISALSKLVGVTTSTKYKTL